MSAMEQGMNLVKWGRQESISEEPSEDFWKIPGRGDMGVVHGGGGRGVSPHLFLAAEFFGWFLLFCSAQLCFLL